MSASFYWSAYTIEMLAAKVAADFNSPEVMAECMAKARQHLDAHFDVIDKHLKHIGAYDNG